MANQAQPVYEDPGIDYTLFNTDKTLMRCTTDRILNTPQLFKDSQIPYGVVVKPFGDLPSVSFFLVTIFIYSLGRGGSNYFI